MAAENYDRCLKRVLRWEGGYVNHPRDPGGATMRGVTQLVYNAYRRRKGLPIRPVKEIEEAELQAIYRKQYWDLIQGDELEKGVDLVVFDFAVNSGPDRATKFLQKIVGVREDGAMGQVTLDAVWRMDEDRVIAQLSADRLAFVKRLNTWPEFGGGWKNRIEDIRRAAEDMADGVSRDPRPMLEPRAAAKKARATDQAVTSTVTGKGAITGGAGMVGATVLGAAEKLSPLGEFGDAFKVVFALLIMIGVGFTIYGALKTARSEEELA